MNIPASLFYLKSHEWIKIENDQVTIGITDFAQKQLGDITYIDLPKLGFNLKQDKEFGSIESVKAASDLYSPVDGQVIAINEILNDQPELINSSPYDQGWIIKAKITNKTSELLDAEAYAELVAN